MSRQSRVSDRSNTVFYFEESDHVDGGRVTSAETVAQALARNFATNTNARFEAVEHQDVAALTHYQNQNTLIFLGHAGVMENDRLAKFFTGQVVSGTFGGYEAKDFARLLAKKIPRSERSQLQHIHLIGCEVGYITDSRGCLAQLFADELYRVGFTKIQLHAITNPLSNGQDVTGEIVAVTTRPSAGGRIRGEDAGTVAAMVTRSDGSTASFMTRTGRILDELLRPQNTFTPGGNLPPRKSFQQELMLNRLQFHIYICKDVARAKKLTELHDRLMLANSDGISRNNVENWQSILLDELFALEHARDKKLIAKTLVVVGQSDVASDLSGKINILTELKTKFISTEDVNSYILIYDQRKLAEKQASEVDKMGAAHQKKRVEQREKQAARQNLGDNPGKKASLSKRGRSLAARSVRRRKKAKKSPADELKALLARHEKKQGDLAEKHQSERDALEIKQRGQQRDWERESNQRDDLGLTETVSPERNVNDLTPLLNERNGNINRGNIQDTPRKVRQEGWAFLFSTLGMDYKENTGLRIFAVWCVATAIIGLGLISLFAYKAADTIAGDGREGFFRSCRQPEVDLSDSDSDHQFGR